MTDPALFPTVLAGAVALVFLGAGGANFAGIGSIRADFVRWGYPAWFHRLCGGLELLGAALVLWPATRLCGLALLGLVMAAAFFTLARHRETAGHFLAVIGISALLILAATL